MSTYWVLKNKETGIYWTQFEQGILVRMRFTRAEAFEKARTAVWCQGMWKVVKVTKTLGARAEVMFGNIVRLTKENGDLQVRNQELATQVTTLEAANKGIIAACLDERTKANGYSHRLAERLGRQRKVARAAMKDYNALLAQVNELAAENMAFNKKMGDWGLVFNFDGPPVQPATGFAMYADPRTEAPKPITTAEQAVESLSM